MESPVLKICGLTDHVHILCMLSQKIALMKLLEELKSHSLKWIKTKDESLEKFYCQDGFGAFSLNPSRMDIILACIENQHEHHCKKNFQQEFGGILKKYKVEHN